MSAPAISIEQEHPAACSSRSFPVPVDFIHYHLQHISPSAAVVYLCIGAQTAQPECLDSCVLMSMEAIIGLSGFSRSTVKRSIDTLIHAGLLSKEGATRHEYGLSP